MFCDFEVFEGCEDVVVVFRYRTAQRWHGWHHGVNRYSMSNLLRVCCSMPLSCLAWPGLWCTCQIPVDYEWPIELSGMQLGSICKQMRIGDIWAKHVRCSSVLIRHEPSQERGQPQSSHSSAHLVHGCVPQGRFPFWDPAKFCSQVSTLKWSPESSKKCLFSQESPKFVPSKTPLKG